VSGNKELLSTTELIECANSKQTRLLQRDDSTTRDPNLNQEAFLDENYFDHLGTGTRRPLRQQYVKQLDQLKAEG
jgi:hypothetical protein